MRAQPYLVISAEQECKRRDVGRIMHPGDGDSIPSQSAESFPSNRSHCGTDLNHIRWLEWVPFSRSTRVFDQLKCISGAE